MVGVLSPARPTVISALVAEDDQRRTAACSGCAARAAEASARVAVGVGEVHGVAGGVVGVVEGGVEGGGAGGVVGVEGGVVGGVEGGGWSRWPAAWCSTAACPGRQVPKDMSSEHAPREVLTVGPNSRSVRRGDRDPGRARRSGGRGSPGLVRRPGGRCASSRSTWCSRSMSDDDELHARQDRPRDRRGRRDRARPQPRRPLRPGRTRRRCDGHERRHSRSPTWLRCSRS